MLRTTIAEKFIAFMADRGCQYLVAVRQIDDDAMRTGFRECDAVHGHMLICGELDKDAIVQFHRIVTGRCCLVFMDKGAGVLLIVDGWLSSKRHDQNVTVVAATRTAEVCGKTVDEVVAVMIAGAAIPTV